MIPSTEVVTLVSYIFNIIQKILGYNEEGFFTVRKSAKGIVQNLFI